MPRENLWIPLVESITTDAVGAGQHSELGKGGAVAMTNEEYQRQLNNMYQGFNQQVFGHYQQPLWQPWPDVHGPKKTYHPACHDPGLKPADLVKVPDRRLIVDVLKCEGCGCWHRLGDHHQQG